jgi:cysteine-rich repeat protein
MGVQQCNASGTGFSQCDCGGSNTCGNGTVESNEQCDDGNTVDNDGCTNACTLPKCGDKIVQAGEDCDDGNNEVNDMCPADCHFADGGAPDGGDAGDGGVVNPCAGKLIFTDFTAAPQPSQWSYMGKLGYDAGTAMCQALGANDVCDYEQMKEIFANPAAHPNDIAKITAKIPAGSNITVWVNRTTTEMVNGQPSAAGPGGRCNNWTYATNHISDGEYETITNTAGALSNAFSLDNDTVFSGNPADGHAGPGLDCGGQQRYIACCFPVCKAP